MTTQQLRLENEELRRRLEEAEETIVAIRDGAVDAFLIEDTSGHRVFTLEGADRPYRILVEQMPQGAATLQADGTILYANSRLAELLSIPHERLVGSPLRQFVPEFCAGAFAAALERGREGTGEGECYLRASSGKEIPVLIAFGRLPADSGAEISAMVTDLTAQKHHEEMAAAHEALGKSEAQRRLALDAAELGSWHVDLGTGHLVIDARCRAIFDFPDTVNYDQLAGPVHPEDEVRVRSAIAGATRPHSPSAYDVQYRIILANGAVRWVLARGRAHQGPHGTLATFDGTVEDITAQKRAEEEREMLLASERAARSEAERAGRVKDEFLATLSHELRTPLNAVLGWAHVLQAKEFEDEMLSRGLTVIERNARLQSQLINDLLDMNSILSGKMRLEVDQVRIEGVIEAAIESVRPALDAKGVRLQVMLEPIAEPVYGDAARLQQVVWNLLSNAVKFTPKGGRVQVMLSRVNSHVEMAVSDTGVGIKPEFLAHVFERFRQADASASREYGGLGLGLSIVKQLVELHGGSVQAMSAGEGHGATFTVALPLMAVAPSAARGPVAHPRAPSLTPVKFDAPSLAGVRVLVVEDEFDSRELIQRVLEECDAHVVLASSGEQAIAIVEHTGFDVILSDIGLPVQDGYSLMRELRRRGVVVPAAALTAFARPEDRTRAFNAGFQLHIAKPVEPSELVAGVASLAHRVSR